MRLPSAQLKESAGALDVRYVHEISPNWIRDPQILAVVSYGGSDPHFDGPLGDPRLIDVPLAILDARPVYEIWRVSEDVHSGIDGRIRWASDGQVQFGSITIAEGDAGGIEQAAAAAYDELMMWSARSGFPGLLRIWNYADALTTGAGDDERYRLFNIGRARGLAGRIDPFPAGTAIGRYDGNRILQVYWLAAREHGLPVENPRQISAFRYPLRYGSQAPSFSRAMLPRTPQLPLFVSGTASVVGHASTHLGDLDAQLSEILRNLASLVAVARTERSSLQVSIGARSMIKAYVRDAEDLRRVDEALALALPDNTPRIVLCGEICRRELMLEIDLLHG